MNEYKIDYELFSIDEIVKIISFFELMEDFNNRRINKQTIIDKYNEYRNILNNKSLEKQYDKMLQKKSNISIYKIMKELQS